jgi:peptidoglycan/LPS O-acetylase OafA/YrhL
MATTSTVIPAASAATSRTRGLWITGVTAGIAASVANMGVVFAARGADVDLSVDGESIPLLGFAQLTLMGAVLGVLLAASIAKRARRPRHLFVTVTIALTALSLIPDVIADADSASKLVLGATHVLAAAVIVPALRSRLPE